MVYSIAFFLYGLLTLIFQKYGRFYRDVILLARAAEKEAGRQSLPRVGCKIQRICICKVRSFRSKI